MFRRGPDLRCGSNAELLHVCIIAQHHSASMWLHPLSNFVFLCCVSLHVLVDELQAQGDQQALPASSLLRWQGR